MVTPGCGLAEAKRRLPLPALLHREGLGEHAQKRTLCPFHEDSHPSFSVFRKDSGDWRWKCFAGCGEGDEVDFLEKHKGISQRDAVKLYLEFAGAASNDSLSHIASPIGKRDTRQILPFDWEVCVAAFTKTHQEQLAEWRGYSDQLVASLRERGLVGLYNGCVAFPVHDAGADVIAAHYLSEDGSWRYAPAGTKTRPLVIGDFAAASEVHAFESQWDGFAACDKLGLHEKEGIAVVATRGASNGRSLADLVLGSATVYLWPQNDAPGAKWADDIAEASKSTLLKRVSTPEPYKDLNAWTADGGATAVDVRVAIDAAQVLRDVEKRPVLIEFRSPLQLKSFVPPPGLVMVGDNHVVKGSVFVIGGAPGVGKSRAAVALAEAGAAQHEWFGLTVHRPFKTVLVQTENGEFRLSREFADLDCEALEDFVRVCLPPPYGLCFKREDFCEQLAAAIAEFAPDVVIFDPWNAAAREQDSREYLETFDAVRSVLPRGDNAPALGIVAHTRKPKSDERASGRALLNLLAGSYVLGSVPRSVFVMQAATDETTDNRVVWTCCKNNDGELGARSVWERRNGLFAPVAGFNWDTFDARAKDRRETITKADVVAVFEDGPLTKAEAAKKLEAATGAHRGTCYRALDSPGRFAAHLIASEGERLTWK